MLLALVACGIAALGLVLLAIAGPAYRVGLVSLESADAVLRWAKYVAIAAAAVSIAAAALAYFRRERLRVLVASLGLLGGMAVFGISSQREYRIASAPPIHDISTDLENPPTFETVTRLRGDAPNRLERPPDLGEEQRKGYPDIAPITLPEPRDVVFDRALAAAQEMGWQIVTADKATGRIEATDTSRWFGLTDDIVVRLTPWGSGTRVDVRSVSRVGVNDAGANARRIRRYLDALGN
jgi:uncharacterized protein (DUF1499 family)